MDGVTAGGRGRNWWKVAFLVLLVVWEATREAAVIGFNGEPKIAVLPGVYQYGNFVSAEGRWTRIDAGSPMTPGATIIHCRSDQGTCQEVTTSINNGYVSKPELDVYPATFTTDQVSYTNDDPDCARYSVRIDLKLRKVFAVRERKNDVSTQCSSLERRIEMTLGSGYQHDDKYFSRHFLPLVWLLTSVIG